MKHVSTTNAIRKLSLCIGTGDLTESDELSVKRFADILNYGNVQQMSDGQIELLNEIYCKHFSDGRIFY